jgi:photosystem II stability/assembly factor-like uncharacterized protein
MYRYLVCFLPLLFCGCRKDLIRYQSALRIDTHTTNRLNRLLFINDTLGFACGGPRFDESDILITHDGGASWRLYVSPDSKKELFGIAQAPDGGVYFIGFDGQLLRTNDGGNSWRFFQLRYDAYKSLAFQDATHAQVVGGVSFEIGAAIDIDTNGNVLNYDSLGYELNDIVLLPDGTGWRCGHGTMQHTTDQGKTWNWQTPRNDNFVSLDVHNTLVAYTCGSEGSIYATRDGGANWKTLRNGNDLTHPKYRLQDLLFTDEQHGYAVGEDGVMIYTDDAGRHWSELERFTTTHLHGIALAPGGDLFVCGEGGEMWRIKR